MIKGIATKTAALLDLIYNRCLDAMAVMAGILVIFMMLTISADIFLRFLFMKPVSWAFEMTEYSLLFIAFLGAAWLLRKDGHVKIDLVINWLGKKSSTSLNILNIVTAAVMMIVCLLLVWYGLQATIDHYQRGALSVKYYALPKFIFLMIIPMGSFFLLVECLKQMWGAVKVLFKQK